MRILGIETSCDETGVAIVEKQNDTFSLLSNKVASSLSLHAQTGGIIPEVAAREQVKFMLPTLSEALKEGVNFDLTSKEIPDIDAIAVTYGPGLIGSLLVGVETAKTLSLLWNKPLIPVNHMYGHLYANWIENKDIKLPAIILIVSGNHTDLLLMKSHTDIHVLGGTRDDASGEAFDKIGRLLGLNYPAGATISRLAEKGNKKAFDLPRPMIGSDDLDFSFSGLKTAVLNLIKKNEWDFTDTKFANANQALLTDLCASVQAAIVDVLTRKTIKAAEKNNIKSILLGGGVAANQLLAQSLKKNLDATINLIVPSPVLCTDNGAMVAAAAFFAEPKPWIEVDAKPELYY
jgi:N6-L-threonylcarbamoyladenine synthase